MHSRVFNLLIGIGTANQVKAPLTARSLVVDNFATVDLITSSLSYVFSTIFQISACRMKNNHSHLPDFLSKMFIFIENPPEDTLTKSAYNISNMAVFTYKMSFIVSIFEI